MKYIFSLWLLLFTTPCFANTVVLGWNPSNDVIGYKIYQSTTGVKPYTQIGTSTLAGYTIPNLEDGVQYYFAVTAYNQYTESDYSNVVQLEIPYSPTDLVLILDNLSLSGINKIIIRPR